MSDSQFSVPLKLPKCYLNFQKICQTLNFFSKIFDKKFIVFLAFANQAQLKELYLNNNNIKSINRKMLLKMQKLEVLDLSYNKIGYVDPDSGTCLREFKDRPVFVRFRSRSGVRSRSVRVD